jgi:hypothetical protein
MPVIITAHPPCIRMAMSANPVQIDATGSPDRAIRARVYSTVALACQIRRTGPGVRNARK